MGGLQTFSLDVAEIRTSTRGYCRKRPIGLHITHHINRLQDCHVQSCKVGTLLQERVENPTLTCPPPREVYTTVNCKHNTHDL